MAAVALSASIRLRVSPSFAVDATFDVPPGITMLFGASGSGKTTLLRAIAGLRRPDAGRVAVGGSVLFDSAAGVDVPVRHRHIGYVAQRLALFPHLTVRGNVEYGLAAIESRERAARVDAALESFRIAHLRARRPGEISGGEQQRVALARAIVTDPAALLLDEPLTGLDYDIAHRIMEDFRAWNVRRQVPVVYVTHAHREVFALGDRVVALEDGKVRAVGVPHEVLNAPAEPALARIAGFENLFAAQVLSCSAESGTMTCRIGVTGPDVEVPYSEAAPGAGVGLAVHAGDILLAGEFPRALSARNIFQGTITSMRREGPAVVAGVSAGASGGASGGALFLVHLTPAACDALGLAIGRTVWLVIKTYSWKVQARA